MRSQNTPQGDRLERLVVAERTYRVTVHDVVERLRCHPLHVWHRRRVLARIHRWFGLVVFVERAVTSGCPCGLGDWGLSRAPDPPARRASVECNSLTPSAGPRRYSTTRTWCRRRAWSRSSLWPTEPGCASSPMST